MLDELIAIPKKIIIFLKLFSLITNTLKSALLHINCFYTKLQPFDNQLFIIKIVKSKRIFILQF